MNKFLEFVAEIFEVSAEELSGDTAYKSIPQWNSLMHLRLVAEIEERFGAEIPIDEVPDIKTLADFYVYIPEANKEAGSYKG